jgi:ferredoxin
MKYKVIYERSGCTGAAICVAAFEKRWSLAEDGKADLKGSKKHKDHYELMIDESELGDMLAAAQGCPVNVIHIEDETGKRLV